MHLAKAAPGWGPALGELPACWASAWEQEGEDPSLPPRELAWGTMEFARLPLHPPRCSPGSWSRPGPAGPPDRRLPAVPMDLRSRSGQGQSSGPARSSWCWQSCGRLDQDHMKSRMHGHVRAGWRAGMCLAAGEHHVRTVHGCNMCAARHSRAAVQGSSNCIV